MTLTTSSFWEISDSHGFLPNRGIAPELPQSATAGAIRDVIDLSMSLGTIDDNAVSERISSLGAPTGSTLRSLSPADAEICLRAYAFVATRVIHGGLLDPGRTLQSAIAFPVWTLSERVGRPPSLTYASYILANWNGSISPRALPESIEVSTTFTSTQDERWFIIVHLAVESIGGEIVRGFKVCQEGILAKDVGRVSEGLNAIESALAWAVSALSRIDEQLRGDVFTTQVRPFLFGYNDVTFSGVTNTPTVAYVGETGAQSGVMRAADSGLGVKHSSAIGRPLERFLFYAPPPHRNYIAELGGLGESIRQVALTDREVRSKYNASLSALAAFRTLHYSVVDRYLSGARSVNPGFGTGGTAYQSWLRGLVEETQEMILD